MSEATVTVLVALLSSSGLIGGIFSIINTIISRKTARGDKQEEIKKELAELKANTKKEIAEIKTEVQENRLDMARIQLLLLMSDYPDDISEIMKAAEKYFVTLGGNFYMDTLFTKWLKSHKLPQPSWFRNHN